MHSTRTAAGVLGVSTWKVLDLIKSGDLKAHRYGGHYRISEAAIETLLCQSLIPSSGSGASGTSSSGETESDSAALLELAKRVRLKELRQPLLKNCPAHPR